MERVGGALDELSREEFLKPVNRKEIVIDDLKAQKSGTHEESRFESRETGNGNTHKHKAHCCLQRLVGRKLSLLSRESVTHFH